MIRFFFCISAAGLAVLLPAPWAQAGIKSPQPAIVAYVFPRGALLRPGQIDARGMTRINYAFAGIANGRTWLPSSAD